MILIGLAVFIYFILSAITAVINGSSFMLERWGSNWLPIPSWIFCSHAFFSHIRNYLLIRCPILNLFVRHCLLNHALVIRLGMTLVDSSNEANHIFLWIRKAEVVLNSFILNSILASLVWWNRAVNLSRAASADIGTDFTCCLDALIVHFGLVDYVLNPSLWNSKVWETPITVTCRIELGILIGSKDFQKAGILFEPISDIFRHWLI